MNRHQPRKARSPARLFLNLHCSNQNETRYREVARYNLDMVRQIDAIFSQGAFRPIQPLALPEGTRVHLRVEEETNTGSLSIAPKLYSPKLAHPKDAADFEMEVQENGNAGV